MTNNLVTPNFTSRDSLFMSIVAKAGAKGISTLNATEQMHVANPSDLLSKHAVGRLRKRMSVGLVSVGGRRYAIAGTTQPAKKMAKKMAMNDDDRVVLPCVVNSGLCGATTSDVEVALGGPLPERRINYSFSRLAKLGLIQKISEKKGKKGLYVATSVLKNAARITPPVPPVAPSVVVPPVAPSVVANPKTIEIIKWGVTLRISHETSDEKIASIMKAISKKAS